MTEDVESVLQCWSPLLLGLVSGKEGAGADGDVGSWSRK